MAVYQEFSYPSADGVHAIVCSLWSPEEGEPKAIVQIVHGISEYVNRYDHLARFLADRGYLVCGGDHLGHGRTAMQDGKFGFFARHDGWTLAAADVRALYRKMKAEHPGVPLFLLGHSMGSFLTRTCLCRYPSEVDGAVLSGTGQESALLVGAGKLLAGLLALLKGADSVSPLVHSLSLGAYNKQFSPNRTESDWISRDEAVVDAYIADPLCHHMPSVGLYRDMLGGLQYISSRRALDQMDPATPVYLYSGDRDPVGANGEGVKKVYGYFAARKPGDLSMKLYPGGRHEMHNETNRDEVYADLLRWLELHTRRA